MDFAKSMLGTAICGLILLSGCATQPEQGTTMVLMTADDLNNFQISCKHKEAQIRLLKRQIPSRLFLYENGRKVRAMEAAGLAKFDASYPERKNIDNGLNMALIRRHLTYLENQCP
jgi:hypothetical protein